VSSAIASLRCCSWLLDGLVEEGLCLCFVSPGSRSAPLALAAELHPAVRVRVMLDERSAGFAALGAARASGSPVVVVTTSGTAVANLMPSVVEAATGGGAVVYLTADRPPWLRGVGANQTIDQVGIFGGYVRRFEEAEVLPAGATAADRFYWQSLGRRAARSALSSGTGPVHINVPIDEPLVPEPEEIDMFRSKLVDAVDRSMAAGIGESMRASSPERKKWASVGPSEAAANAAFVPAELAFVETRRWPWSSHRLGVPEPRPITDAAALVAERMAGTQKGLLLVGGLSRPAFSALEVAGRLGWPIYAEPLSQMRHDPRVLGAGWWLVSDEGFLRAHRPDIVVQIGKAPSSRPLLKLLREARDLLVVSADRRPQDPLRKASLALSADPERLFLEVSSLLIGTAGRRPGITPSDQTPYNAGTRDTSDDAVLSASNSWSALWEKADAVAAKVLDEELEASATESVCDELSGTRYAATAVPPGSSLFVGSSSPVRDLDASVSRLPKIRLFANRGASGIDGCVSTAAGIAQGMAARGSNSGCVAILGDLAFLHDLSGVLSLVEDPLNLTLVVLDNGGGGIFKRILPPGTDSALLEKLFVTPQRVSIESLCRALRMRVVEAGSALEIGEAVGEAAASGSLRVVVAKVAPERTREVQSRIAQRLSKRISVLPSDA
jgi:2-succinyl-5-enolpyruvyl-6-hydroxy-3-cyclohexene-1-carboxylate synthase